MIFAGFFLVVIGLFLVLAIIGIIPLAIGILLIWGTPTVNVVTAGGTATPVKGWPWQKEEAEAFVSALRNQLFSE